MGCGASAPAGPGQAGVTEPPAKPAGEESVKDEEPAPPAHVIEPEPETLPVLPDAPEPADDGPVAPVDGALAALATDALKDTVRDLEDLLENVPHASPVFSHIRAFFTRAQQVQHDHQLFLIIAQQIRYTADQLVATYRVARRSKGVCPPRVLEEIQQAVSAASDLILHFTDRDWFVRLIVAPRIADEAESVHRRLQLAQRALDNATWQFLADRDAAAEAAAAEERESHFAAAKAALAALSAELQRLLLAASVPLPLPLLLPPAAAAAVAAAGGDESPAVAVAAVAEAVTEAVSDAMALPVLERVLEVFAAQGAAGGGLAAAVERLGRLGAGEAAEAVLEAVELMAARRDVLGGGEGQGRGLLMLRREGGRWPGMPVLLVQPPMLPLDGHDVTAAGGGDQGQMPAPPPPPACMAVEPRPLGGGGAPASCCAAPPQYCAAVDDFHGYFFVCAAHRAHFEAYSNVTQEL